MSIIDWIMIGIYFIFLIFLMLYTRKAKSMDDYAVGSRQIPAGIIFATLSATFIGPGYSMGLADKAAGKGYIWVLIFFAFSLQTILIGKFVAPNLRKFSKAYSSGDIMGYRYGKLVKVISGIFSVAICAGFVGVIAKASGDIIHLITGIPFLWAVIISTIFVIIYSTFGGIKTVVLTDVFQFIILSIMVPLSLIFLIGTEGFETLINKVPKESFAISEAFSFPVLIGLFLGFFLGETLIPPYANRALMSKDSKSAKKGFIFTGIFSIAWFFVCATIGILGSTIIQSSSGSVFIQVLQKYLPIGLSGIAIAAIISIVMSSQDSILNAASVSFSNDILKTFSTRFADEKLALKSSRWLNVGIGIIATVFALNVPGIVEALLYCYTLWAPTIVLPLIIASIKKDVSPYAGLFAILSGGIATGIWEWVLSNPYQIPSLIVGVIINQIVFWSIQFLFGNKKIKNKLFIPVSEEA